MSAFMPKYDPMDFPVEVPANMTLGLRSEAAGSSASVLLSSGYNHGPVTVRVTTIVAPNRFWVHEIPPSPSEYEKSNLKLVLEVERCLAARYNSNSNDARGIIAAEDLTENLMVRAAYWMNLCELILNCLHRWLSAPARAIPTGTAAESFRC